MTRTQGPPTGLEIPGARLMLGVTCCSVSAQAMGVANGSVRGILLLPVSSGRLGLLLQWGGGGFTLRLISRLYLVL